MVNGPKKTETVLMPQELYLTLKRLAQEEGYSLPGYIRQVLKVHVRRLQEDAR